MNYSNSSRKHFLLFSCFVVFLLFFRARWAFAISYVDETCYLESLHKLLGLNYPACYLTTHLPGVVLSWVPVAGLAALLSQISSYGFEDWLMPLLGLFSFGILTRRKVQDRFVPYVCMASPVICYFIDKFQKQIFGNFQVGMEMLIINGLLTFTGLLLLSRKNTPADSLG